MLNKDWSRNNSLKNIFAKNPQQDKRNISRISLPPIKPKVNMSTSFIENKWKIIGTNSPLFKQDSINFALKRRKQDVVLNLKRNLKNPHAYVSNECDSINYDELQEKYRRLTLKICDENN
ncbi:hypothetical protein SteCoe_24852 [Stentor coeruleus]|uniref:Uncharacterized protein n=1 Tax=Stentor coeruleus TaxID=5963 RepID=A0A1R2BGN3_9CILI|nr:hypothetical protein SteCoe_24852 [Stentor coeruleus]